MLVLGCLAALPGGALHLYLTATYKSHEVQPWLLFRDIIGLTWPIEKLHTLMTYLLLVSAMLCVIVAGVTWESLNTGLDYWNGTLDWNDL